MPVPYTMEAVAALRHAERTCTPAEEIQRHLGWDDAMFARVCRKHGIGLIVPTASSAPSSRFVLREPLAPIAPYPPEVAHIISKLTARQAEIFRILRARANDGKGWVKGADIADAIPGAARRSTGMSTAGLARRLQRMHVGYQIETQRGLGGGYRLIIDGGEQ